MPTVTYHKKQDGTVFRRVEDDLSQGVLQDINKRLAVLETDLTRLSKELKRSIARLKAKRKSILDAEVLP